ncbi:SMI1/KNR4 family protein [Streptomyces spororaveus]|nr:SMI1/KNR4 family protein [Streptomyces spororaveus]
MPSALEHLQTLLGEPEEAWGRPRREVWEASEQHLGVTLPADYKAFMDVYGPGTLDGYLHLNRPTGLMTPAELEIFWSLEGWRDARRGAEDLYPFPFHPDPGGLIPWGHDEHSSEYYFLASDPDPGSWEIVVGSECAEWYRTSGSFTDFLMRCFEGLGRARSWTAPGPDVTPATFPSPRSAVPGKGCQAGRSSCCLQRPAAPADTSFASNAGTFASFERPPGPDR